MNTLLELLTLLALRVGAPLLVTFLISAWLLKLDQKWRNAEIARQMRVLPMPEAPRCWETRGCDTSTREQCSAYNLRPLPCWIARYQQSGRVPQQCFECAVFQTA